MNGVRVLLSGVTTVEAAPDFGCAIAASPDTYFPRKMGRLLGRTKTNPRTLSAPLAQDIWGKSFEDVIQIAQAHAC
jgi:hypothetical protein